MACVLSAFAWLVLGFRALLRGGRVSFGALRWTLYVFAAWWLLHALEVLIGHSRVIEATRAVAAGLVASGLLLVSFRPDSFCRVGSSPRMLRIADLILGNVALLLILGECGVRGASHLFPSPLLDRHGASLSERLAAHRTEPFSLHYGRPRNSLGYVDEEFVAPPGSRVIVSIGDSFSQGAVPWEYHFTTVCEERMSHVEVFNIGVSGIGLEEYRSLMETEALPLSPDVLVVNLFVGNDLVPGTRHGKPRGESPPREYGRFDLDRFHLPVVVRRVGVLWRESSRSAGLGTPQGADARRLSERSKAELEREFPWLADPMLEAETFSETAFLDIEQRRARGICASQDDRFERAFAVLTEMRRLAGDTPLLVVLIPDEFQVEDALWEVLRQRFPAKKLERDRAQTVLIEWLTEQGISFVDLLPEFRQVEPLADGRRHLYHRQDTHFNARGNRLAGQVMATALQRLIALDSSDS